MPTYTYKFKDALDQDEETLTLSMSILEMQEFEKNNPQYERVFHTVNVVDPVGIGVTKPSNDFTKHVLGRIKANVPENNIGNRRWKIPKEI
jgi:hypothetical protein